MTPLPLRRIMVSNFRRLKGDSQIPLDAPIVLIYGANGSGKTSILAAIEFALTGEIRSMRRVDDGYTAYLPHRGSAFATIEIEIADEGRKRQYPCRITVGGDEIKGSRALDPERAQFYTERAYLDQTSLGQLLDLYQYTEGNQESALARFVNELLGLDQLDALRSGLHDATDVRRLRKLSSSYADAESKAEHADKLLDDTARRLSETRRELAEIRDELQEALEALGLETISLDTDIEVQQIESLLARDEEDRKRAEAQRLVNVLLELRGRIRGLRSRPAAARLNEARAAAAAAEAAAEEWRTSYETPIAALQNDVASLGIDTPRGISESLVAETRALERRLAEHESASKQVEFLGQYVTELRHELEKVNADISRAEARAGSFATGLAALREQISGENCPVCNRDFSEISAIHLLEHIDRKIDHLANEGAELQAMVDRRLEITTLVRSKRREVSALSEVILADVEFETAVARKHAVTALFQRFDELAEMIVRGAELNSAAREATAALVQMDAEQQEQQEVTSELATHASVLGAPTPAADEPPENVWERLNEIATARLQNMNRRRSSLSHAADLLSRLRHVTNQSEQLIASLAEIARSKQIWQQRVSEADRRRDVARAVHAAASNTRTAIVQRVFTQSLNDVWSDVFSRLAPSEPFVPAFGIPTARRAALKLHLETIHESGDTSGTPSMMLSTGNLNTAALSLFIALHLAVEPQFPCLVFDDPVQSMDEVHIAQFAGLLRMLSKQHDRQIVIAIHERELFEYLRLELSPAFDGDELITIELGLDSKGSPVHRSTRLTWIDDAALAI